MDIFLLKSMVIAVGQRFDVLRMRLHVVIDLLGRSDARQQQHVIVGEVLEIIRSILITLITRKYPLQLAIVERREVELLIGV